MMNNGGTPQQPPMSPEDMDKMMKMKALQKLQMQGGASAPQAGMPAPGQLALPPAGPQQPPMGGVPGQPNMAPTQAMPPQQDPSAAQAQPNDLGTDLSQQDEAARLMAIRKKLFPNSVPQQ